MMCCIVPSALFPSGCVGDSSFVNNSCGVAVLEDLFFTVSTIKRRLLSSVGGAGFLNTHSTQVVSDWKID